MEFLSKSVEETAKIAANFAKTMLADEGCGKPKKATIVGLYGELGSGKTTFMKYLAENLGIAETIKSPTFVIMKIYKISPPVTQNGNLDMAVPPLLNKERGLGGEVRTLIHIDAYRIEKEEEILNLGWQEIISDPKNLVCIEWPGRIAKIMPEHIMIIFEHIDERTRRIIIKDNEKN